LIFRLVIEIFEYFIFTKIFNNTQELMAMREDKAELRARVFLLEKERATIELKLNARDTQIAAQHATIQHLQGQLSDAEAMLAMATNKVSCI